MGWFDDLSNSFINVFTRPGKANFGDFATVTGSLGGATAAGFGIASLVGGSSASAAATTGADVFSGGGAPAAVNVGGGAGVDAILSGNALAAYGAPTAAVAGSAPAAFAGGGSPAIANLAGGAAAGGGFWSGLGSAISSVGSFITGTITTGATALGALGAYQALVSRGKQAAAQIGGAGGPSGGSPLNISLGGGFKPSGPGASQGSGPIQASSSNPIMIFVLVGIAVTLLIAMMKKKK